VAQLTGRREFWDLTFKVTQHTLDPRPDSEALIEAVLARFRDREQALRVLDLGTGTGCLLLTLLKEYPNASGLGVDICPEALGVAQENALNLGLQPRVDFVQSCWAEQVKGMFDIVISNPPYIPTDAIEKLAPEVARFEPKLALDGGADGLDCYRTIVSQLPQLLSEEGMAVFEIGFGQAKELQAIVDGEGLQVVAIKEDLAHIPRCVLVSQCK
jgi:release factor glutamine methyltransferase